MHADIRELRGNVLDVFIQHNVLNVRGTLGELVSLGVKQGILEGRLALEAYKAVHGKDLVVLDADFAHAQEFLNAMTGRDIFTASRETGVEVRPLAAYGPRTASPILSVTRT